MTGSDDEGQNWNESRAIAADTTATVSPPERSFLVYVNSDDAEDQFVELELEGLCEAVGAAVVGSLRQRLDRPHKAAYLGKGKVEELHAHILDAGANLVIVDAELTGIQLRNLEEALQCRVVDRMQLILDIFARRAKSREGQLQVELAQLTYMLPRLMAVYTKFERQKGGIGMRGPGETKLESDRRMVRDRIAKLKTEIEEVKRHRTLQRAGRMRNALPCVAIVGYTSAGKSTLMNRLCQTDLLADAMPFATLDPTTRKLDLPDGGAVFLSDTVGFIRNLPSHLVAAFRSTLEEVVLSDLILHVVDLSHPDWEMQRDAVMATLNDLDASDIPMIIAFNKVDLVSSAVIAETLSKWPESVAISAATGDGLDLLLEMIVQRFRQGLTLLRALVPYSETALVDECYQAGRVVSVEYIADGVLVQAEVCGPTRSKLERYAVSSHGPN